MKRRFGAAHLVAVMAVALAGCGDGSTIETGADGGEASCALVARYHDQSYEGIGIQVAPPEGDRLGFAVLPGCNDTGETNDPQDEMIPVARLPGVSPKVALVWSGRNDLVLIREGTDPLPHEVVALLDAPSCDNRDAPIRLVGPWLGILGVDGNTEVDLAPPYDIDLLVEDASTQDYEDAFLTVRVPDSLGRPLTRDDLRSSLWEGGTIQLVARCEGSRFVAQQVTTQPPD